jgi:Caspase domain
MCPPGGVLNAIVTTSHLVDCTCAASLRTHLHSGSLSCAHVSSELRSVIAGRKKALIIGCTYPGSSAALGGCVNDALCMEYLLRKNFGFQEIRVLRDDKQGDRTVRPTRQNIFAHIRWLVEGARPGDSLFFHFSGALPQS